MVDGDGGADGEGAGEGAGDGGAGVSGTRPMPLAGTHTGEMKGYKSEATIESAATGFTFETRYAGAALLVDRDVVGVVVGCFFLGGGLLARSS